MKKALLLLLMLIGLRSFAAESAAKDVDSTLFVYYQWCNEHRQDSSVLLKADTMLRIATEKNDARMQCIAMEFNVEYYYFTNNLDSLKVWIPRVQEFSRARQQLKYYYFAWTRLILYHTKHTQYTLAQYELERYLAQAAKDNYKPGIADAYIQLAHIYSTKALLQFAAEYYRKAIDYIEQNDLDKFALSNHYSSLAGCLIQLQDYTGAADAIEKGIDIIALPEHIWKLKRQEVDLCLATGKIEKAKNLFREIEAAGYCTESEMLDTEIALYRQSGEYEKALGAIGALQKSYRASGIVEKYYSPLFFTRAQILAAKGDYQAAYNDLLYYASLYKQKISDENQSSLSEFATLLDVNRLDHEKALLQQQAQADRLQRNRSIIIGLGIILMLAIVFIVAQTRSNRRMKQAMRAAEKANHMKGIFIRNITHEINTPLNAIVGFAELTTTTPHDDPERESYINIIKENSGYLQKLVNDVLYISDLESSEESPFRTEVDINACCRQCIGAVRTANSDAGTRISFRPGREHMTAVTSRMHVAKVICELVSNAVRFSGNGSVVLSYDVASDARTLTFSVTDTGPGIPENEAGRIFDRFVKLNSFTQGMGLGLSVCRLIAEALGGSVRLDTTCSVGSRFLFTIPIV